MSTRREVMNYIGTGAIGGIIGYYAGAQELLGIQSERVVRQPAEDSPTEDSPTEDSPTEDSPTNGDTPEPSGENIFDDFEGQELDWEITNGDASVLSFSTESVHGDQSLYFEQATNNNNSVILKSLPDSISPTSISYWFKYQSNNDNQFNLKFYSSENNQIIEIREFFQEVHYKNTFESGVTAEEVAPVSQQEWYQVTLQNINFDNKSLDIVVADSDGNTINQVSNVGFRGEADNFQRIRIANGLSNNGGADPLWIDYIRYQT